jgi:hypothetical protein
MQIKIPLFVVLAAVIIYGFLEFLTTEWEWAVIVGWLALIIIAIGGFAFLLFRLYAVIAQ